RRVTPRGMYVWFFILRLALLTSRASLLLDFIFHHHHTYGTLCLFFCGCEQNACTSTTGKDGTTIYNCGVLAWNGQLPSGEMANSAGRKQAANFPHPGFTANPSQCPSGEDPISTNILTRNCDDTMGLLLSSTSGLKLQGYTPAVHQFLHAVMNISKT